MTNGRGASLGRPAPASGPVSPDKPKPEPRILFQTYFKSVGPRTYAAQVKEAANGNQFLVITEGKRDEGSDDVRKTRVFVFSEDFVAFFAMMKETANYLKAHPVPQELREKRQRYWARKNEREKTSPEASQVARTNGAAPSASAKLGAKPRATARPVRRNGVARRT